MTQLKAKDKEWRTPCLYGEKMSYILAQILLAALSEQQKFADAVLVQVTNKQTGPDPIVPA